MHFGFETGHIPTALWLEHGQARSFAIPKVAAVTAKWSENVAISDDHDPKSQPH
jgi:hypothetical protein